MVASVRAIGGGSRRARWLAQRWLKVAAGSGRWFCGGYLGRGYDLVRQGWGNGKKRWRSRVSVRHRGARVQE
ncbi:unnamed protein product [Sphenostylis stenocarpa]|uniref:Uncharacterized protein n=1 Tax=Sphenostylis stenocarpa TaxID=92480 RepID=A0AA86VLA4_9FABA|nr:unnamed protein product [Sphenostylis stenocarpa]